MDLNQTFNAKHYEKEMKFMLDNPLSRIFLFRLITESCHTFDIGFAHNASAYSLLAKQDIGKVLMLFAKEIDLDKFNQAEKEYYQMIKTSQQQQEGMNNE